MKDEQGDFVSVLMPVYNAEKTVACAVSSILQQSHSNFEFIIIDDGSDDQTSEILAKFALNDDRIVVKTTQNNGVTAALNLGLGLAKGKWIARQDADDCSVPSRISSQLAVFEKNENVVLVGSAASNQRKKLLRRILFTRGAKRIAYALQFRNVFIHSSVMFKRVIGGKPLKYDVQQRYAQDFELFQRLSRLGDSVNLPQHLVKLGEPIDRVSMSHKEEQRICASNIALASTEQTQLFPVSVTKFLTAGVRREVLRYIMLSVNGVKAPKISAVARICVIFFAMLNPMVFGLLLIKRYFEK